MHHVRKLLATAATSAAFAFAVPANAAVLPCTDGGIDLTVDQCIWSPGPPGNDDVASVAAAILAATGVNASLTLYDKSGEGPDLVSFSPDSNPNNDLSTDWSVLDGTLIKYVTIKAANEFKVYELPGAGASSGLDFSTVGMVNGGGNQPTISHLSFWTVPEAPVPEPSTWALMLVGFGAVGWGIRRGKLAARQPRIRVLYT